MPLALVTDSTADLPPGWAEAHGVRVVPLYVHLQGKTYKDGVDLTAGELVRAVQAGAEIPTTSQPTPEDFKAAYTEALAEADQVLSIHISSKLSGTVQSARMAAEAFGGRVRVYDTLEASAGIGALVMLADELRRAGLDAEAILKRLQAAQSGSLLRFTVASLEFLKKNGRIGGAAAFLGGLLRIKPILTLAEGRVEPAGKARGEKRALAEMTAALKDWSQGRREPRVAYLYAGDPAAVEPLKARIRAELPELKELYTGELGAVITSHVGPGTYGFFAFDAGQAP